MYVITYKKHDIITKETFTDTKDLADVLINLLDNPDAERKLYDWCNNANFGDSISTEKLSISCVTTDKSPVKIQVLVDKIYQNTQYKNDYIGFIRGEYVWTLAKQEENSLDYIFKFNPSSGLLFQIKSGKKILWKYEGAFNEKEFVCAVISKLNTSNVKKKVNKEKFSMHNRDIVEKFKDAVKQGKEIQVKIYDDGCWYISIERLRYGTIRIWVGYEDKRSGRCNSSLCTVYDDERYAAEFKLKEPVRKKILSIWKELKNQGLVV